jgi:hypothetical protein
LNVKFKQRKEKIRLIFSTQTQQYFIMTTDTMQYIFYAGAAGMLLHMNGKFRMGKLKSSLLSSSFVLSRPSLSGSEVFLFFIMKNSILTTG